MTDVCANVSARAFVELTKSRLALIVIGVLVSGREAGLKREPSANLGLPRSGERERPPSHALVLCDREATVSRRRHPPAMLVSPKTCHTRRQSRRPDDWTPRGRVDPSLVASTGFRFPAHAVRPFTRGGEVGRTRVMSAASVRPDR